MAAKAAGVSDEVGGDSSRIHPPSACARMAGSCEDIRQRCKRLQGRSFRVLPSIVLHCSVQPD
ncbi:hypothetical protein H0E84_01500 [Luteimonas sp. SJ-92]|uniref:Uncharacterized protein n=1 Tax=Luteimonas salinisoli TaxID=2752307 RepID=A0A853J8S5_9GAMM|nr:hypothetical protein [Luteimonas salinisoli]NZA25050.1 hypothetical protein [Luteimonas salinisoli]